MKPKSALQRKGALDLIEEAVHLLRLAPASALLAYYLGSLPFVLGVLYFWADMSRSSFAERGLPLGALAMALLFLWMKTWQSVFARRLLARLCLEPPPRLSWAQLGRLAVRQTILQPSGLLLLPATLVLLVPFGWVYAFYQNVTVLDAGEAGPLRQLVGRASRQAALWPGQNHVGLITLKVFGLFVVLDLALGLLAVPFLLKSLLGVETVFSRSWGSALNTTFVAAVLGLAYLCMDPLAKTFYLLRCFYGESLQTGQDLKIELRSARRLAAAVPLLVLLAGTPLLGAQVPSGRQRPEAAEPRSEPGRTPAASDARKSLSSPALGEAIQEVMQRREYDWRSPREKLSDADQKKSALAALMEQAVDLLRSGLRQVGRWLDRFVDWIFGDRSRGAQSGGAGAGWIAGLRGLLVLLIVALAAMVAVLLVRWWRRRGDQVETAAAQPVQAVPDLTDEKTSANQLPEDGWASLARELLEKGEFRLALRAYYLSSLAHLAAVDLIRLAKFKSNRDYERELSRRSHALPEVAGTFAENVTLFDRVWYGLHEVTRERLHQFAGNVDRIRAETAPKP